MKERKKKGNKERKEKKEGKTEGGLKDVDKKQKKNKKDTKSVEEQPQQMPHFFSAGTLPTGQPCLRLDSFYQWKSGPGTDRQCCVWVAFFGFNIHDC